MSTKSSFDPGVMPFFFETTPGSFWSRIPTSEHAGSVFVTLVNTEASTSVTSTPCTLCFTPEGLRKMDMRKRENISERISKVFLGVLIMKTIKTQNGKKKAKIGAKQDQRWKFFDDWHARGERERERDKRQILRQPENLNSNQVPALHRLSLPCNC